MLRSGGNTRASRHEAPRTTQAPAPARATRWSSKCRISGSRRFSHLEPQEDDTLMEELLTSNPKFQALVAKSKAGPRKPFSMGQQGLTNG